MKFEEALIHEVKRNEALYDLACQDYKNILLKDKLWRKIGTRLGVPDEICKKRWKTLRDTYKRIKQRLDLQSGRATPELGNKQWKYFHQMSFLDGAVFSRHALVENIDIHSLTQDPLYEDETILTSWECTPETSSRVYTQQSFVSEPTYGKRRKSNDSTSKRRESDDSTSKRRKSDDSTSKRRNSEDVEEKFSKFLNVASSAIAESSALVKHREKSGTMELLEGLGSIIDRSSLNDYQLLDLERSIAELVFSKLDTYRTNK